jgi:hypothetical protein
MRDVHLANAWILIGLNAAAGVWCLAAYRWPSLGGRPMWITVIVAQVSTFTQAVFGALLANQEDIEINDMHMLYGFSAMVAVGIMYSYRGSPFMKGKSTLLYGFGGLFIMGLGLRNLAL